MSQKNSFYRDDGNYTPEEIAEIQRNAVPLISPVVLEKLKKITGIVVVIL
jgi:hypothetical protein